MFNLIQDVEIISSLKKNTATYGKIESRKTHGFIFKITGKSQYFFDNKTITLNENEVIFLPQGSCYEYSSEKEGIYTSINFTANIDESIVPTVYQLDNFYETNFIFEDFSNLWKVGSLSDKYKCLSIFYDFLSYIARIEHLDALDKYKYYLIEPAMEYLKTHIFDCNLKIDNLHRLCLISDTYFRKIFLSWFNVSPQEYVIQKRISHAKSIIDSADYDTIREVSELVGYKDPLYFSKAFKRIYGISPSEINQ